MLNSNRNLLQSFKPLQAFREKQEEAEEKKGMGHVIYFHLDEYPGPEENSWNKRYLQAFLFFNNEERSSGTCLTFYSLGRKELTVTFEVRVKKKTVIFD